MDFENPKLELDAVLDTLVDGVIMINDKGLITRYNPSCVTIFQYSKEEVIGQNVKMLMPEPYHSNHDDYIENYQATGTAKIIGIGRKVEGRRRDGSTFPMYLSVGKTQDSGRTVYVGIIRDLSEEWIKQSQFEHLQQQHFHLSRVAAMDQMGSAIAHELNQPLTSIMNYLEAGAAMLERNVDIDKTKLTDILNKTSTQTQRAAQILGRLRRFIETGNVEKEITNIADTVLTAIDLVRPSFKNSQITVSVDIESDLPNVVASDIQIQQVLVNIIRNACEAMESSAVKQLTIGASVKPDKVVEISVKDTGSGMSDREFEKLYEPFTTSKEGGLGVGLSISRTIISNHDGKLWAERNTPHGSCFYITLPMA